MRTRILVLILIAAYALLATPAASASRRQNASSYFTGYGFDACAAPALTEMEAWLASPYRAIGIYLGGANRACPDGNLTPSWVSSVRSSGWNLLPLWVGLQAPCVTQKRLKLINPVAAGAQGKAAADSASARASYFGIEPGSPIYYDMEGYGRNASCTRAAQRFLSAWTDELHAKGYLAGAYGSADSTIRDLVAAAESGTGTAPDDVWIARWNGVQDVFGDPVAPDSIWSDHQRTHQYRGGHRETFGGVSLNIDSDYVGGAVVVAAATFPTEPPVGSVSSSDGLATASWWESSLDAALLPSTLAGAVQGFAAGSYLLRLEATDTDSGLPAIRFDTPLQIHVTSFEPGAVVAYSSDGLAWKAIPSLSSSVIPVGQTSGYLLQSDGSLDIYTFSPGYFGLLRDITAPTTPASLSGRFKKRRLVLRWPASTDNSGVVTSYQITLNRAPLSTVAGDSTDVSVSKFKPRGWSVYRVYAVDSAGNASAPSQSIAVFRLARPRGLPRLIPSWAWRMLHWQAQGRKGRRPHAPRSLPAWYWRWAGWQLRPYRLSG
ncbi:MAG: glycoside hydrolase domain-containing protein [Gaiellaceae bacterium]|jgi:hypothetical protein